MSSRYFTVIPGATLTIPWSTNDSDGASIKRSADGLIKVYKNGDATSETDTGVTDDDEFDTLTGVQMVSIDTSTDTTFYALGNMYHVILSAATIDAQVVNYPIASFVIGQAVGVTVSLGSESRSAEDADGDGTWTVLVPIAGLTPGMHRLEVTADGPNGEHLTTAADLGIGVTGIQLTDFDVDGAAGTPRLHRVEDELWLTWADRSDNMREMLSLTRSWSSAMSRVVKCFPYLSSPALNLTLMPNRA